MNYIYLDQNIIDRIDKGLKDEVIKFLEKNSFIPAASLVSLIEIERGKQIERTFANIQALVDIGASIIYEENSETLITEMTRVDKVIELILRKDYLIYKIVKYVLTIQFYKITCTSRYELEEKLTELLQQLKNIVDRLDKNRFQATINNLLILIDTSSDLLNEAPERYNNLITDFRSDISLAPRELNNLNLKDLWEKIDLLSNDNILLDFNLSNENPKERLYNHLLMLNLIGYWCDDIGKEKRHIAFNYDCMHGIYGSLCHSIVSSDKRFLKRLKAAYYHLSIHTKIFHLSENLFNELD